MNKLTKNRIWFGIWTSLLVISGKICLSFPKWSFSLESLFWGLLFTIALNGTLIMYLVIKNEGEK